MALMSFGPLPPYLLWVIIAIGIVLALIRLAPQIKDMIDKFHDVDDRLGRGGIGGIGGGGFFGEGGNR